MSPDHFRDVEPDDPYAELASKHSPSESMTTDVIGITVPTPAAIWAAGKVDSHPDNSSIKSWNEQAIEEMKEKGVVAPPFVTQMYHALKMLATPMVCGWLADREPPSHLIAAWEFYKKKKSSIAWDLVIMNPPFAWPPKI
ncbi:hypothetical protein BJV78DRAFT_1286845 [Lactifluus subvellereus]|nr:hypothetical protein BJV78DRAFT_1286845 [Lactifluus subvellereus]